MASRPYQIAKSVMSWWLTCWSSWSIIRRDAWPHYRWEVHGRLSHSLVIPPLPRDCDLLTPCATIKLAGSPLEAQRRQNDCLGRLKEARRMFMDAITSMLLNRGWRKAGASPWLQSGCTMVGQLSPPEMRSGVNIFEYERCFFLPCTTVVPPLADQWRPSSDYYGDKCASIRLPQQPLSPNGNVAASTLPPLSGLLCLYSRLVVQGRLKGRAAAVK